ncbi:GNAT family N-acetyltransferase [bacterium]|nr:GNAT family N-acetyltransferase [bacterium]
MDSANLGFLARHLVLTEFNGEIVPAPGGCYVLGDVLWAAIWQPEELENPEGFIKETAQAAQAHGLSWAGAVAITPPARESDPLVAALSEALYVYGYEQRNELGSGGPDTVLVLAHPPVAEQPLEVADQDATALDAASQQLLAEARIAPEQLSSPWRRLRPGWLEGTHVHVARVNGQPVGLAVVRYGELASRVLLLYVAETSRQQGIGRALLAHSVDSAQAAGRMLNTIWVYRGGKLRYYFTKQGYAEQLSALYFIAEK